MRPLTKIYAAECKTLDATKGIVERYSAVFNNVDLIGDRVMPGFFAEDVAAAKEGKRFPVIYSHQSDNLDAWVGETIELEEVLPGDPRLPVRLKDLGGLRSKEQYFMAEPTAAKVVKLMARGLLQQGSFGYHVDAEKLASDGANELIKGRLVELGPTLRGMNALTETVSVKSLVDALDAVIRGEPDPEKADEGTDIHQAANAAVGESTEPEHKDDEPQAKSEDAPLRAALRRELEHLERTEPWVWT